MRQRRFHQLDVFSATPLKGNPLAVVHDAEGLSDVDMAAFARWTNLSETTFLLPPEQPQADYRVRIFTPSGELPFAGHPTLGSCFAWLAAGGRPKAANTVLQECGVGLVTVRQSVTASTGQTRLAFAAPPLRRSGPLEAELLQRICQALRLPASAVVQHQWVDNGPGWCAVMLGSAQAVRETQVDWQALGDLKLGLVGPWGKEDPKPGAEGHHALYEVRALFSSGGVHIEDPVTGSLNASVAQWLIGSGWAPDRYQVSQGACLGRAGIVHIERDRRGPAQADTLWVGGDVAICVDGNVMLP